MKVSYQPLPSPEPETSLSQSYHNLSDAQIWTSFRNGSEEAYYYIYNTYFSILYNYGRQFCSNREQVKDCIQDVFVSLWHSKQQLGDTDSIKFYLFKALKRSIAYSVKKSQRQHHLLAQVPSFEVVPSHEDHVIFSQTAAERKEKIKCAVNALSARQREVIFLLFYEEFTYPQIAELLTVEVKTARNLVGKALQSLRQTISFSFFLGLTILINFLYR